MTTVHQMLESAFKAFTTGSLGDSLLVPDQRDRFLQALETRAPLLRTTRRITMRSHTTRIDRWTLGQVLEAPAAEGENFTGETTPTTDTNTLAVTKVRGRVPASDEALADSLARGDAAKQLIDLIGARAGVDLELLLVQGDTTSGDPYLALLDGWLVKAAQQLTGSGTAPDFDATDVEEMFDAMLMAIEPRFLTDRARMRFFVPWNVDNDYRDKLRARGTELADRAQVGDGPLSYKGITLVETPAQPADTVLFSHTDNIVYGIWQDLEIEDERVAAADRHDFHVRARADADYEDENGAVVATGYTG